MKKADHPKGLLHGSPVPASLGAAIMNGTYVNVAPLYRLEKEFERYGMANTRQNMANWMIRLGEEYLKVFLTDGDVPMDNNASEYANRGLCIKKKNWGLIDTINGAKTSALIYSIAETAKANNLKPYEYYEHLLTEIPKHMEDTDHSFLNDLFPWSSNLLDRIRKPKQ